MTIIEDFEGDLSQYTKDEENWEIVSSPVYEGSGALKAPSSGNWEVLYDLTNREEYPDRGDTFEFYFRHTSTSSDRLRIGFATQSYNSDDDMPGYYFISDPADNDFGVKNGGPSDGKGTWIANTSNNLSADTWYRGTIDFGASTSDTIEVSVTNPSNGNTLHTVSGTDTTYDGGGIVYSTSAIGSATQYFDYVNSGPPLSPNSLSASSSGIDVDLSWTDNATDEDGFYIYRATSSGTSTSDYTQVANLGSNTTSYTDTSTSSGQTYYYRVSAYNSSGESQLSNEASAETALSAPSSLSASVSNGDDIDLTWTNNSDNEDGFYVYRATSSGTTTADYSQVADISDSTGQRVVDISNGFEDMGPWTVYGGGQASDRVYDGSNSYYSGNDFSGRQARWAPYSGGSQPDEFVYYYQETTDSSGGGVRLMNSDGNYEGGTITDNPEYYVDFANGIQQLDGEGSNYDSWVKVTWDFDWSSNEVTITFNELSSSQNEATATYTLKQGLDIEHVELWNYNNNQWANGVLDMWWDLLQFANYDTTASYTDMSLLDGERYYYRVTAYQGTSESDVSNEANATTVLPAPSNLTLS